MTTPFVWVYAIDPLFLSVFLVKDFSDIKENYFFWLIGDTYLTSYKDVSNYDIILKLTMSFSPLNSSISETTWGFTILDNTTYFTHSSTSVTFLTTFVFPDTLVGITTPFM